MRPLVGHADGIEAHPGEQALHESVALGQLAQHFYGAPVDQAEVADILRDAHRRHRVEHAIEPAGRQPLGGGVPGALGAHAVDDVVALAPARHEGFDQLRRILQVDVHRHDDVAPGMVDAGGQRGFLAEIARQVDHPQAAVAGAAVEQAAQRIVARAVIHEHDLEAQAVALHQRLHRVEEDVDRFLLVEHRHHQRQQRIGRPARTLAG